MDRVTGPYSGNTDVEKTWKTPHGQPSIKRHRKVHADDKPHRCDQCDASFNLESNLLLHQATHCTSDPVCPECGKKFSRVASLKAHVMLHEKEENLECPECGDEFSTQPHLDKHMQVHCDEMTV
ncbi:zinc finger protein 25-like [Centruroides sculpturatus]|uniref:zinc finger protein 25-like n=1 Tax=Centruroides sculpturatus TaxID=218467 RepID=UPI000C6D7560|nr:zinc finger protein 25-like [Centruroides sculpturatus]